MDRRGVARACTGRADTCRMPLGSDRWQRRADRSLKIGP